MHMYVSISLIFLVCFHIHISSDSRPLRRQKKTSIHLIVPHLLPVIENAAQCPFLYKTCCDLPITSSWFRCFFFFQSFSLVWQLAPQRSTPRPSLPSTTGRGHAPLCLKHWTKVKKVAALCAWWTTISHPRWQKVTPPAPARASISNCWRQP